MRLTKRELLLLVFLLVVAVVFGGYQFVYKPVISRTDELRKELDAATAQADAIRIELATKSLYEKRHTAALEKIGPLARPFFSKLDPDVLILRTREAILASGLVVTEYTIEEIVAAKPFNEDNPTAALLYDLKQLADAYRATMEPSPAVPTPTPGAEGTEIKPGNSTVEVLVFQLSMTGTYDQWKAFVATIESYQRTIQIDNLVLSSSGPDALTANCTIRIYGLEKIIAQPDDFQDWPLPSLTPAVNPFP